MIEPRFRGVWNRFLQAAARSAPGARTLRVRLHRWRGVEIGKRVWISYDCILETAYPTLISIGDDTLLGMRVLIIGHFRGCELLTKHNHTVRIGNGVYIGPGSIILPNVAIGNGAVIAAGSVINRSVPPMVLVQGNPARPVARCGVPLQRGTSMREFSLKLRPIRSSKGQ